MVKNFGGNKSKRQGRKFSSQTSNKGLRVSKDPAELYAIVTKMCGGPLCDVRCIDAIERRCVIRNKFRGRGKRGNIISVGTWLLVGLRDWEVVKKDKKQQCDLLEVYNDGEKERLKKN